MILQVAVQDMSSPMAPFSVTGFKAKGPAQQDGAMVGWYLDVDALIEEDAFQELTGEGLGDAPTSWEEATEDLASFQKRLELLLEATDVCLTFHNGLDFSMLPSVVVSYDGRVGEEISEFESSGEVVTISSFATEEGPAREQGPQRCLVHAGRTRGFRTRSRKGVRRVAFALGKTGMRRLVG
eukprot:s2383_g8.t1